MAKFGFSPSEVDVTAQGSFDPMPAGEYTLKATDAEERDTKAGTGQYIAVTFEVAEGEFKGRKVWMNYNVSNPSEKAQEIGRQQLVSWATATGKPDADDTDKLIDRPFVAVLGIEESAGYAPRNNIKSYIMGDAKPVAKAPAKSAPAKPSAPAKAAGGNPWD